MRPHRDDGPDREDGPARRDWRDVLTDATDLAVLGIVLTLAALPVLTAAAAVAAASAAVHDRYTVGSWPSARENLTRYGRALLPGAGVSVLTLAAFGLLAVNVAALAGGRVPGGAPLLLVTVVLAAALAGYAALVVVEVGRRGGRGWREAAGAAAGACRARPGTWAAAGGVSAVAALLAVLVIPVAVPILAGYVVAALHAVARRTVPAPVGQS
ncbi:hypothetical protein ACLQ20_28725 [Micromonospora sp. DT46]|uniref:hypothetical protein n=1 Tax=unclassified Micromonospora TaxID=2617518 RepID=UPI00124B7F8D|nr:MULTISPECIES: hypothetical protein [unclassified Micromonospora]KAB1161215.1 hypothetical protein F6X68_05535 [Micromonospora sp. AMSO12t]WSG01037.1 hypothetical protein OG989_25675 [Micromonospora sp. NBC_01740]